MSILRTSILLAASSALALVGIVSAPPRLRVLADAAPPADAVEAIAALALAGCAIWAWITVLLVVAEVWLVGRSHDGGRITRRLPGIPAWARAAVVAALGSTLVASPAFAATTPAAPSAAERKAEPGVLAGLPYPDRAEGPAAADPVPRHVVAVGECLWTIVADRLPDDAPAARVAALVARTHALNRAVVGPDPDVLLPGQDLRLPLGAPDSGKESR